MEELVLKEFEDSLLQVSFDILISCLVCNVCSRYGILDQSFKPIMVGNIIVIIITGIDFIITVIINVISLVDHSLVESTVVGYIAVVIINVSSVSD